jgi:predicted HTH transcriptional regulator
LVTKDSKALIPLAKKGAAKETTSEKTKDRKKAYETFVALTLWKRQEGLIIFDA